MNVIHLFSLVNKQMRLNKWQNYKKTGRTKRGDKISATKRLYLTQRQFRVMAVTMKEVGVTMAATKRSKFAGLNAKINR